MEIGRFGRLVLLLPERKSKKRERDKGKFRQQNSGAKTEKKAFDTTHQSPLGERAPLHLSIHPSHVVATHPQISEEKNEGKQKKKDPGSIAVPLTTNQKNETMCEKAVNPRPET